MVEPNMEIDAQDGDDGGMARPETVDSAMSGERSPAFQWTAQLVANVDKRLKAAVSADELKKLTVDYARPEFKKVL